MTVKFIEMPEVDIENLVNTAMSFYPERDKDLAKNGMYKFKERTGARITRSHSSLVYHFSSHNTWDNTETTEIEGVLISSEAMRRLTQMNWSARWRQFDQETLKKKTLILAAIVSKVWPLEVMQYGINRSMENKKTIIRASELSASTSFIESVLSFQRENNPDFPSPHKSTVPVDWLETVQF